VILAASVISATTASLVVTPATARGIVTATATTASLVVTPATARGIVTAASAAYAAATDILGVTAASAAYAAATATIAAVVRAIVDVDV
jgi:hypothetical protein